MVFFQKHFHNKLAAFTLTELMMVIAMIGVLAAVLYPVMMNYMANSRDTQRISAINKLSMTMEVFYKDQEQYPPATVDGCIQNPDTNTDANTPRNILLTPKYIRELPKSPIRDYDE